MVNGDPCPCGGASPVLSNKKDAKPPTYGACCGRFMETDEFPGTAIELMRSRYTAHVVGNTDYLRKTWAARTCPADLDASSDKSTRWLGLQIKRNDVISDQHAEVEFVARYKIGGRAYRLHESSRFERDEASHWRYIDGLIHNA